MKLLAIQSSPNVDGLTAETAKQVMKGAPQLLVLLEALTGQVGLEVGDAAAHP